MNNWVEGFIEELIGDQENMINYLKEKYNYQADTYPSEDVFEHNLQNAIIMLVSTPIVANKPERYSKVIILRYKHGYTYKKAGEEINVTPERARQMICKALRRLRQPIMVRLILSQEKLNDIKQAYQESVQNTISAADNRSDYKSSDPRIDTLGLSVRAYNCLNRTGITRLSDLEKMTVSGLHKIRNCGDQTVDEICEIMVKLGKPLVDYVAPETTDFSDPQAVRYAPIQSVLTARTANALKYAGICCLDDLEKWTLGKIYCTEGIGRKSLEEIAIALLRAGIEPQINITQDLYYLRELQEVLEKCRKEVEAVAI